MAPIVSPGTDELTCTLFWHTTVQILFNFSSFFSRRSKRFGLRPRVAMRSNLPKISRHTLSFTERSLLYWHNQWSLQVRFPDAHKADSILEPTPILLHGLRNGRHSRISSDFKYPPGQNGRHFANDIFICIFVNETFCILIKISLIFVSKGPNDNRPALV